MALTQYIKEIGRGKDGARPLSREQAADLFGQILDGLVSDLEIGAFCLAMRIKGETTEEMCGFLEAVGKRLNTIQACPTQDFRPVLVIPSYNGARKLPGLTPLLAHLLAREGFPVAMHGTPTEDQRVFTADVLGLLGTPALSQMAPIENGQVAFYPTALLHPGLQRLLDVRRVVGLRNPAHSLVKLLQPCAGPQVLVTCYTHPEYAQSMEQVLHTLQCTAMLIRGTEGEAVADPRRMPKMTCLLQGHATLQQDQQPGTLTQLPELPAHDAPSTARYIRAVLSGSQPVPQPIAVQVQLVTQLANALSAGH